MKNCFKIIFVFIFLLLGVKEVNAYDYTIQKYDIDVKVNENNTFDITEKITANFNVEKHGIFRKIPLKNSITRLDGSTSNNRVQISNVNVDNEYTVSKEDGQYMIKIGSAYRTLTGMQSYTINYKYNIGKDPLKDVDELYFNLIGNEWDTSITNITFKIEMPKEFDSDKLGFSSGIKGSVDNVNVNYSVEGNIISGSYKGVLNSYNGLTVRCELPDGYFVGAGYNINPIVFLMFIIPVLFLGISILMWYKFGKDEVVVDTVEFYPPEGFNSLEIGYLYKGVANNNDVISLLIYLANKGYIKISETEEKSLFSSKTGFKITKLKDYDGNNINEKIFLSGLFKKRLSFKKVVSIIKNQSSIEKIEENEDCGLNEVDSIDLYDSFYITMSKILTNINCRENKNKIFEKSSLGKSIFIILMIIIVYCLITIVPIIEYGEMAMLPFALIFPGVGFSVMFAVLFGKSSIIYVNGKATNSAIVVKIFVIVWGSLFAGIPWSIMVMPALLQNTLYFIIYFIGLMCVLGMILVIKYLPKRSKYGNEILGKINGFKNFLETAEKDKLETMVMNNPLYFYDILPYTYVLGVSDKWINKFESIALKAPDWYDSPNTFSITSFNTFVSNTMSSAQTVMSSSPSSSSSSGGSSSSSGGGSSGGGSGGGGGGSW